MRAADDVLADGLSAIFVASLCYRLEDPQTSSPGCIEGIRRSLVARQQIPQVLQTFARFELRPAADPQTLGDDLVVHVSVLDDVERRQMKAESTDPAQQAAYQEIPRMPAAIVEQAAGGEADVGEQFLGVLIGVGPPLVSGLQPLAHLSKENSIRHAVVACRNQCLSDWQHRGIRVDARGQRAADRHAARALAQRFGQLPALGEVARHDHLPMTMQGLANGLAVHIIVAVHVASHPGAEAQDVGHVQLVHGNRVGRRQRRLQFFIEERHDSVQNVDQVKQHVLAFVGDREVFAGMLLGLPDAGDLQAHARPQRLQLRARRRQIVALQQVMRDLLLLSQDRAACRFGGM